MMKKQPYASTNVFRNVRLAAIMATVFVGSSISATAACNYTRDDLYPDFAIANGFANLVGTDVVYEQGYGPSDDRDGDGVTNFQEWQGYESSINGVLTYFGWRITPLTGGASVQPGSCLDQFDSDNDGASDFVERQAGSNPQNNDTDGDGMFDSWEIYVGLDPRDDGTTNPHNAPDADPDGDGLDNIEEMGEITLVPATLGNHLTTPTPADGGYTLPLNFDTDGDRLIDSFEYQEGHGLNPVVADEADADPDRDGLTTFREQCVHPLLARFWANNNFPATARFTPPVFFGSLFYGGFERSGLVAPGYMHRAQYNAPGDEYPAAPGLVLWGHPVTQLGGTRRWTNPSNPDTDSDLLPDGWEIEHGLNPLNGALVQNNALGISGALGDPDLDSLFNLQEYFGADGYRIDFITGTGDETIPWILRAFNNTHRSDFASRIGQVGMGAQGDQSPVGYGIDFIANFAPDIYPGFFDPEAFDGLGEFRPVVGVPPFVGLSFTNSFNPFATALTGILFQDNDADGRYSAGDDLWLDLDGDGAYTAAEPILAGAPAPGDPGESIVLNYPIKFPIHGLDTDNDGLSDSLEIQFDISVGKVPTSPVQSHSPFVRRSARITSGAGLPTPSLNPIVEGRRFFSRSFTVEAWVYLSEDGANDYRGSFARGVVFLNTAGTISRVGYDLGVEVTGGVNSVPYFSFNTIANQRYKATSVRSLPKNRWVHLAGTFNHAANSLSLYIDGLLEQSLQVLEESSATFGITYGGQLTLARDNGGGAQSFADNLWLDEVRVWGIPRTADEISNNRNRLIDVVQQTPSNLYEVVEANSLFVYYSFDDGGDSAEDLVRRGKSSLLGYNYPHDSDVITFLNQEYLYTDPGFALSSDLILGPGSSFVFDASRAAPVTGQVDSERGAFDSDRDGLPDDWEIIHEMNPFKLNTPDHNQISQYDAAWATTEGPERDDLRDHDNDGLPNMYEYWTRTNPRATDTDLDGIFDGDEDFDGDGIPNRIEKLIGSRPDLFDTDDDGTTDNIHFAEGTSAINSLSKPKERLLRFDGNPGSFLLIPDRPELRLNNWTIEAKVTPNDVLDLQDGQGASIIRRVVQQTTNGLWASNFELRVVRVDNGGNPYLTAEARYIYVENNGNGQVVSVRGDTANEEARIPWNNDPDDPYPSAGMVHLAASFNEITGDFRIYLNGTVIAFTQVLVTRPPVNGRGPFLHTRVGEGFHGVVDDIRIWNVVRTAAQIRDAADRKLTGTETNLVSYFRLDDGGWPALSIGQSVLDIQTAPPGAPAVDDRYIVLAPAAGDWVGQEGRIATYNIAGLWTFEQSADGTRVYVSAAGESYEYDAGANNWVAVSLLPVADPVIIPSVRFAAAPIAPVEGDTWFSAGNVFVRDTGVSYSRPAPPRVFSEGAMLAGVQANDDFAWWVSRSEFYRYDAGLAAWKRWGQTVHWLGDARVIVEGIVANPGALPPIPNAGDVYFVLAPAGFYTWNNQVWVEDAVNTGDRFLDLDTQTIYDWDAPNAGLNAIADATTDGGALYIHILSLGVSYRSDGTTWNRWGFIPTSEDFTTTMDWMNQWARAATLSGAGQYFARADAQVVLVETDCNADGIPDWWYVQYGYDPCGPSIADLDPDGDGLSNYWEYKLGGDPFDPFSLDISGNLTDGQWDSDGDGLSNLDELTVFGTDPSLWDTDEDGYGDGAEIFQDQPNPADDYGIANQVSSPIYARSPMIHRSLVARGRALQAPFSDRFAFSSGSAPGTVNVEITAPTDGFSSPNRFIDLSATIESEDPLTTVRIFVSGQLVRNLGPVNTFTETIIINSGANEIEVQAIDVNGGIGSDTITVNGTFAPADIRVTQTWNLPGDLDTWLVDPQRRHRGWTSGGPGYPDSIDEQIPGSFLDIDDITGTGPENVTVEQGNAIDGSYEVWMNNFSHSDSPLSTVRVLVNEGTPQERFVEFGPRQMPTPDFNGTNPDAWWLVTTITWPSGDMNPPGSPVSDQIDDETDFESGLGASDGWTVEAWVRPGTTNETGAIAAYRMQNTDEPFSVGLLTNQPYVRLLTAGGSTIEVIAGAIPSGEWTHIAAVYSKSQKSLRLFVNGYFAAAKQVLVSRDDRVGNLLIDTFVKGNVSAVFSNSHIDEIRVWSRARNGGLIASQMHVSQQPSESLVAYYWFDDGGLGIEDATRPLNRDYDLGGFPLPDFLTDAKPGPDGVWGTGDDIPAGPGADGHNDYVTGTQYAWVFGHVDSDGDGLPDWWEQLFFGNTTSADPSADTDSDGLDNLHEYWVGTHPLDADTDGDGIIDGFEDYSGNGLINLLEQQNGSDPRSWDTDNDGVNDFDEVQNFTDPLSSLSPLTNRVLSVDGNPDNYVRMAHENRYALSNWVIEAWVYPTNATPEDAEIIARPIQGGLFSYYLGIRTDGRPEAKFTSTFDGSTIRVLPPASLLIPQDQWTHLRAGFDADAGHLYIEVDGIKYSHTNTAQRPDISGLGYTETRVGRGFQGYIDEVRIWSHYPPEIAVPPLAYPQDSSALEVLYPSTQFTLKGNEAGLISYLRFDDGVIPPNTPRYHPWAWNVVQDFAEIAGVMQWNQHWLSSARLRNGAQVIVSPVGAPTDVMFLVDENMDGIPDWWQDLHWSGFNPNLPGSHAWDAMSDPDGDGLWNLTEFLAGLNPNHADSYNDGVLDGLRDSDGDGLSNLYEQNTSGSRVDLVDTDDDGLTDWEEAFGQTVPPGWLPGDPLPPVSPDQVSSPIHSLDPPKKNSLRVNGDGHIAIHDQQRHALRGWTLQTWVRPDAGAEGILIRRRAFNPLYSAWGVNYELGVRVDGGFIRPYARYIGFTTNGTPHEIMVDGTLPSEVNGGQLAATLIRQEEWSHLAATYDPDSSTLSLYINGELSTYRTDAVTPWGLGIYEDRNYRGEVRVGGGHLVAGVVTDGFEGYLDHVMILSGASDADAVQRAANNESTITASLQHAPTASSYAPVMQTIEEALAHEHQLGQILVRFKDSITLSQAKSVGEQMGMTSAKVFQIAPIHLLSIEDGMSVSQKLEQVRAHSSVLYAEPNYKLTAVRIPNDPSYSSQWALNNNGQTGGTPGADISAEAAWDRTIGNTTPIVAVIDSGVDYLHGDLAANIWSDVGYDFFNDDSDPMDDYGHGTHVAGTIGAVGNNGLGIAGVNWRVRIMALKFLGAAGFGFTSDAIAAIQYAVANGARISNNSWGSYGSSQSLFDAINAAGNAGHLFIAAAGNANFSNDIIPFYPASYNLPNIISVASMDHNGNRSTFSNFGQQTVHLGAPGSSILSTLPNNSYGQFSGTSMAAPHVAGVAALILSQNPGISYTAIRQMILNSVDPRQNWEGVVMTGGTLNAGKAVGGSGTPVLFLSFNDGGETAEDFTMSQDWDKAWHHAGRFINDAAFNSVEFFDSLMDSNGDGIPDWWYEAYGFDPMGPSIALDDSDGDGLNNLYEYRAGTHPFMPDSNMNGTTDANEDPDGDGLTNLQEQMIGTHPMLADTDDDGAPDGVEVTTGSDPLSAYSPENFRAMNFDGSGRLLVRTERDIDSHQNWTVEAWVRPETDNTSGVILRRAEMIPYNGLRWVDYELGLDGGVPYILYAYRQGGVLVSNRVNGIRQLDAKWSHIAAVQDETDHQLRLYVNGKRVNYSRPAIRPPVSAFGIFETTIGGGDMAGAVVSNPFRGQIDNVRIWDYARSGLEIQNSRDILQPEFLNGVPDANRAPIRLFNFDDGGAFAQNSRYLMDWITGWRHAAELQGTAAFVASPWPPIDLDSDDDTLTDHTENTSGWAINRSELPFVYRSLNFNGDGDVFVDELVDNDETALYALTNWTVEAWVQPTAMPAGLASLVQRLDKVNGRVTFELGVVNDGGVLNPYARFQRDDSGNDYVALTQAIPLPVGAGSNDWSHLAATFSNGVFSLFVNGGAVKIDTVLGAEPYVGGAGYVLLGSSNFIGNLQEVRIWNEPRTQQDINDNFRNNLLFSAALLESSFDGGNSYLGRNTMTNENGLAYDYSSIQSYEGIPYLAGRRTHKFVIESWVKLDPGSTGGIIGERKIDVQLLVNEPDWRINHSLRVTENGNLQGQWMGEVFIYVPVREDIDDDEEEEEGDAESIVVRLDIIQEVVTRNLTSEVDIRDGQWHHVALVGDSQRVRLYIDGHLDREITSYYTFRARDDESFEGFYFTYMPFNSVLRIADDSFDGIVDEIIFWNEDISRDDILRHRDYGLDKSDIKAGLAPIDPLPAFAITPSGDRHRLVSYVTFDGELVLPFVPDRANNEMDYRILPLPTGSELLNPSTPPIMVDRMRTYDRQLRGYFATVDGGEHVENYMERNDFGHAGLLRGGSSFITLDPLSVTHLITDSDGDGLPDWWETLYGLDPGSSIGPDGAWGDPDGDGLSNIGEYYSGTDPRNFDTAGDGFSDYDSFGPGNVRTWGDIFSDGDGMSDEWESQYPGFLSPTVYDADEDPDGDGWSNLAEFMFTGTQYVEIDGVLQPVTVNSTDPSNMNSYPTPTLALQFKYAGLKKNGPIVLHGFTRPAMDGNPDIMSTFMNPAQVYPFNVVTSRFDVGYLREGNNRFFAFIDNNINGVWDPDEPAGMAQAQPIDVSWGDVPLITIGLTDSLPGYQRFNWPDTGANAYTVSIRRTTTAGQPLVITNYVISGRNYMHEGDYQYLGLFGLDAGASDLPGYQAFVNGVTNNFGFNWSPTLAKPTTHTPAGPVVFAKNDFIWSGDSNAVQSRLQIRSGTTNGPIIFNRLFPTPHREVNGRYNYTLPIYAGDPPMTNGTYYWRVLGLNPRKVSEFSDWRAFAVSLSDSGGGAYSIAGTLFYFGQAPATSIVVQAFLSNGFSGKPDAQTTVSGVGAFKLQGLPAGTYHVLAFIDQNGNKILDSWESWGFIKDYVAGDDYTVKGLPVPGNKSGQQLVIRDRDSNNNGIPDAWEFFTFGGLNTNPAFVDSDGDGIADWQELFVYGSNPYNPDSSGDGISDGQKVALGLDPTKLDSDGDGFSDAAEILQGTDPTSPGSVPPTADVVQILGIVFGANQDVITYDIDPAVVTFTTNINVHLSATPDLMLPFQKLLGSDRTIYTTNWTTGPWTFTNTPPVNQLQFYRTDWKIKSN